MINSGKWIWCPVIEGTENTAVFFRREFTVQNRGDTILKISADTRYVAYINGVEIGRGPIRSTIERWFYDEYDLSPLIDEGKNTLAVRVWDYGQSTYQTIVHKGGLVFSITGNGEVVAGSDEDTLCVQDKGLVSRTVKRNVNLGFMEHYDARKAELTWWKKEYDDSGWEKGVVVEDDWGELAKRPVKYPDRKRISAGEVVSIREVKNRRKVVSLNARDSLFPGRRDANATIMTAYIGAVIESDTAQEGIIAFPTNKWNGMHGNFKIDGKLYPVGKGDREKKVSLKRGKQFFLMELNAKFDDLFAHIEYEFEENVTFREFFTAGPLRSIENKTDGYSKIYGGLNDYDGYGTGPGGDADIFSCLSKSEIEKAGAVVKDMDRSYVFNDEYIFSLVKNTDVLSQIPVGRGHNGILHGNSDTLEIDPPSGGGDMEVILDFTDIFVGNFEFSIKAPEGAVMDIYCYENMYGGEIDYTFGLNNSIRYICKDGWQEYSTLSRIGLRYMMIVFRNQTDAVEIKDMSVMQAGYPVSRNGNFRCSDWKLNKIFEISRRTNMLCSEDTFADSPTYEQAYWSGDAQVSAAVSAFYFGEYELLRHCLMQVPLGRKYTRLLPALMPTDWETAIPMWTMNWMISIEQYIFYTGDGTIAFDLYDEVVETLMYYFNFITDEGAFSISAWNMVDWAPMDIGNEGVVTAQHGLLAHCCKIAADLAKIVGRNDEVEKFNEKRELLLSYLDEFLWDENRGGFFDGWEEGKGYSKTVSVQTNTLLEQYGLIEDKKKREMVIKSLKGDREGWVEPGSPFIFFYLFEVWHKYGMDKKIIEEIREKWGMMLRYDSTTCWEVFPGFYENSRTRSYCHSWSSSPGYIMIKYILGMVPVDKGFARMKIDIPETDIEWAEGSIPTPLGRVDIYWSRVDGKRKFRARLPKDIEVMEEKFDDWDITLERY